MDPSPAGDRKTSIFDLKTTIGAGLLSVLYFADIFWRSARKPLWFDELFTWYLCRLPTFRETWMAVQHGADFNPPLFYVFTRTAQALFGQGNIATRLPETVGVWLFCMCLFIFVARRLGRTAGLIAGAFPFLTLAQYYAYEARPHGITLGWCGLALLCWQRIVENGGKPAEGATLPVQRLAWHLGFVACMLGSVLTHVYAVYIFIPFALVEAWNLFTKRTLHWGICAGLVVPAFVAVPLFLPMIRTYKAMIPASGLPQGGAFLALLHFAQETLGSSILVLLMFVAVSAMAVLLPRTVLLPRAESEMQMPLAPDTMRTEMLLAFGFMVLPLFGLVGLYLSHGGFFYRYFLSSIAGVAILLGYASYRLQAKGRGAAVLAGFTLLLVCRSLGDVAVNVVRGRGDDLIEPSSRLTLFAHPAKELEEDVTLMSRAPLPILDISAPTYIYFLRYAPQPVLDRMVNGAPGGDDLFYLSYERLAHWAGVPLRQANIAAFLAEHDHFYVYSSNDPKVTDCGSCADIFLRQGLTLLSYGRTADGVVAEYSR